MKLKISYLILFTLILNIFSANATIRFVSKTGTSTPPYTSWATAADSIQKCINICSFGDTIYVANGTYYEAIYVDRTINLIGSSMDSTIIDGFGVPENFIIYFSENNSTFNNFNLISPGQNKTGLASWKSNLIAESCKINNVYIPISIGNSSVKIRNFIVTGFDNNALRDECPNDTCNSIYSQSIFISKDGLETPVLFSFGGYPTFTNNIVIGEGNILRGIDIQYQKGTVVKNNLISGFRNINLRAGEIRTDTAYFENNNIMNSSTGTAISTSTADRTTIRNNIIKNTLSGVQSSNGSVTPDYNLFWNVINKIGGTAILGDSNMVAEPMFVNDTIPTANSEYDFHLQKYSPAINKGDPSTLDVDSSRSDIGMYGGPGGEYYKYLDLAPRTPRNFNVSFDSTSKILLLNWDMATESDFRDYKIFRDTIQGFIPNQFNLIAQSDTSLFSDNLSNVRSASVYYKITAVDNQDNERQPGNEIAVTITGIEQGVEILRDYILFQNYPNPFNPGTKISYEIKNRSYVKLMVYDIKGELVSVLINKEQTAGYYEVDFNATDQTSNVKGNLASGIYLYRIEVIGNGNIPVYTDMKKMILLK